MAVSSKLNQDDIILDFNSEKISVPKMAEKYNVRVNLMRSTLKKLQQDGIIGRKNKAGKIVVPPKKFKYNKKAVPKTNNESLADLLNNVGSKIEKESISTLHKEMLVEILHRIIT